MDKRRGKYGNWGKHYEEILGYVLQIKKYLVRSRPRSIPTLQEYWDAGGKDIKIEALLVQEEQASRQIIRACDNFLEMARSCKVNKRKMKDLKIFIDSEIVFCAFIKALICLFLF